VEQIRGDYILARAEAVAREEVGITDGQLANMDRSYYAN
jgi:hypothetical protein